MPASNSANNEAQKLMLAPTADQNPAERAQRPPKRAKDELEFLPAALEILETPASPAARAVALTLVAFFTVAVLWAIIGEVDVVAVAQGRIVSKGGVQTIQPLEIGVVRAIRVRNGQKVRKGDVLLELDPTESEVDKDQVARERMAALVDLSRLRAMLSALDGGTPAFDPPKGADHHLDGRTRASLGPPLFGPMGSRR